MYRRDTRYRCYRECLLHLHGNRQAARHRLHGRSGQLEGFHPGYDLQLSCSREISGGLMQGTASHILRTALAGLEWTESGRSLDDFLDRTPEAYRNTVGFILLALFRNRKNIHKILLQYIRKMPEKKLFFLLEITTAQIFYCRGIAGESAVNVAVDYCRKALHPKAAGFLNAVLRKITAATPSEADFSPRSARLLLRADGDIPYPILYCRSIYSYSISLFCRVAYLHSAINIACEYFFDSRRYAVKAVKKLFLLVL